MRRICAAIAFLYGFGLFASTALAMEAETTRVTLWARGETIAGEDFLVIDEDIVDYIATLRRPTGTFERIRYQCQVKSRAIMPSLITYGTPRVDGYVEVRMVYELRDCVEEDDGRN